MGLLNKASITVRLSSCPANKLEVVSSLTPASCQGTDPCCHSFTEDSSHFGLDADKDTG